MDQLKDQWGKPKVYFMRMGIAEVDMDKIKRPPATYLFGADIPWSMRKMSTMMKFLNHTDVSDFSPHYF